MKTLSHLLFPSERISFLYVFIILLLSIAFALVMQYAFDVKPCMLCLYQRYLYYLVMGLLVMGIFTNYENFFIPVALVFLGNAVLGGYQVMVEQSLIAVPKVCSVSQGIADLANFKRLLTGDGAPPCNEVQWELFGISMAGYSILMSAALGVYSIACKIYYTRLLDMELKNAT